MNVQQTATLGILSLMVSCTTKQSDIEVSFTEEVTEEQPSSSSQSTSVKSERSQLMSAPPEPLMQIAEESESIPQRGQMVDLESEVLAVQPKKKGASMTKRARPSHTRPPVLIPPPPEPAPILSDSGVTGEEYTDYGINPFVLSAENNLSTFSIDIDTASYAIARRKLREGTIPSYAGIRVEEFINYFDYHYDSTTADPFVVDLEAMKHPFKEDRHILRVGLQGKEITLQERPPLHLTFLVDVSGSMSSADKLPLAKEAMHLLVDTLHEGDTVALATYAGNISKILAPTYGDEKAEIHRAIERLNSGGSTAMSSGLELAYDMAWNSFEAGAENRVIVLSDGDANIGNTSWQDMLKQIKSYADRGITLSTIGFGMGNYKDTSMEQLANKGDGNNYYIDSKAQAHRVFVTDFNSTMISIARDVKIQLEFNPESVESHRLIGYENRKIADKDFRNDRVDAGEVGSGHNVTALYEVRLTASPSDTLATARVRYEKPGPDSVATERSWTVQTSDIRSERRASDSLKVAFTAGTFAEILRRSPHVTEIALADLIKYAEEAQRRGEDDETELIALMKTAEKLGVGPTLVRR